MRSKSAYQSMYLHDIGKEAGCTVCLNHSFFNKYDTDVNASTEIAIASKKIHENHYSFIMGTGRRRKGIHDGETSGKACYSKLMKNFTVTNLGKGVKSAYR